MGETLGLAKGEGAFERVAVNLGQVFVCFALVFGFDQWVSL